MYIYEFLLFLKKTNRINKVTKKCYASLSFVAVIIYVCNYPIFTGLKMYFFLVFPIILFYYAPPKIYLE